MAFVSISPSVEVTEVDLTNIVPQVSSTGGAYVGQFNWGPANKRILIDSETTLVNKFAKPDSNNVIDFYSVSNFLQYGNNIKVVRAINANTLNATANGNGIQIVNEEDYLLNHPIGANTIYGPFYARYAGAKGNSLKVSVCSSTNGFKYNLTANTVANSNVVTLSANTQPYFVANDTLSIAGVQYNIVGFGANTDVIINSNYGTTSNGATAIAAWQYAPYFDSAPSTSLYTSNQNGANDEMHIIVLDEDGLFSGTKGTVLERYSHVSKGIDAKNDDNTPNYWDIRLQNLSSYIYSAAQLPGSINWGSTVSNVNFTQLPNYSASFGGGIDVNVTNANREIGWDYFRNPEEVDVQLLVSGASDITLTNYIQTIANERKDCVAFFSPLQQDAVNSVNMDNIIAYRNSMSASSSYGVMDSGWGYQYDKYNNKYIWVPLNADTAGLCVRTDSVRDPWWSPAGFNRGQYLGKIKVSWNPTKAQRDELYKVGINPVLAFPGEGIILYGDKTLQSKPSAFDRINVRRLFIVLEKSIATFSRYSLFEFNDAFTRAAFVNGVTPYLRAIQGRRGVTDFLVQCDERNNTPQVIDANQFIGTIFIKPARSINFIQLYFVATPTGVAFQEIQNFGQ